VGVPHGTDDGETITRMRHVQVGKQNVKVLCRDATKRSAYIRHGDYIEPIAFERRLQHLSDGVVVLCQ
jgi:hypothetical protein